MNSVLTKLGRTCKKAGDWIALFRDIDRLFEAANVAARNATATPAQITVFNNSGSGVVPGEFYGRDTSGRIALAKMGAAASAVIAQYLCLEAASPGSNFAALAFGPASVKLVSTVSSVTAGAAAWISASNPGYVTDTPITTSGQRRQKVGIFFSTTPVGGKIQVDVKITGDAPTS